MHAKGRVGGEVERSVAVLVGEVDRLVIVQHRGDPGRGHVVPGEHCTVPGLEAVHMRDEAGQASVMARAAATVRLGGEGAEDRLTVDLVKPVLANESQSAGACEWIFETGDLRAQVFFSSIDRGFQQFASAVSDKVVMRVGGV